MNTERTTAKIVYDLRHYADVFSRFNTEDSGYKTMEHGLLLAADRLEQHEALIHQLRKENECIRQTTITIMAHKLLMDEKEAMIASMGAANRDQADKLVKAQARIRELEDLLNSGAAAIELCAGSNHNTGTGGGNGERGRCWNGIE